MIKFLSITTGIFVASVAFLYYLVNNPNFLPIDAEGNGNVLNMVSFTFLGFLSIFCLLALIIFGVRKLFIKPEETKGNIVLALRQSALFSVGLLIVFVLHIFHIVNFVWGLALLVVVITSLFII